MKPLLRCSSQTSSTSIFEVQLRGKIEQRQHQKGRKKRTCSAATFQNSDRIRNKTKTESKSESVKTVRSRLRSFSLTVPGQSIERIRPNLIKLEKFLIRSVQRHNNSKNSVNLSEKYKNSHGGAPTVSYRRRVTSRRRRSERS